MASGARCWKASASGTSGFYRSRPSRLKGCGSASSNASPEPEDCEFSAYLNPVRSTPRISRDRHGVITITQDAPGELRYTLDGSEPTKSSKLYTIPFTVKGSGVARVRLFQDQPLQGELAWLDKYREATFPFGLSDDDWEVVRADSEYAWPPGGIRKSDSKDNILHAGDWLWRSGNGVPPPHELVVDMKKSYAVDGFIIRTDNVKDYEFYVGDSPDKIDRLVAKGALEGACMDKQIVRFTSKSRVRYCRLVHAIQRLRKGLGGRAQPGNNRRITIVLR